MKISLPKFVPDKAGFIEINLLIKYLSISMFKQYIYRDKDTNNIINQFTVLITQLELIGF